MTYFTRITPMHFTKGSTMHAVLAMIDANPNIWLQELADSLGVYREYLQEYTRYAANAGWVERKPEGRRVLMVTTDSGKEALEEISQTHDVYTLILSYIYLNPGATMLEAFKSIRDGVRPNASHFSRLLDAGLLDQGGRGFYCTKAGVKHLKEALAG